MLELSQKQPVDAIPAATVIVCREQDGQLEVLLLKRNPAMKNMGGIWVFPGGKVDAVDPGSTIEAQARAAAIREVEEEAGLQLPAAGLLDFSHWLTPSIVKRRFATWFYICAANVGEDVTVDGEEMVEHPWIIPAAALAQHQTGELLMPPPTLVSLHDVAEHSTFEALVKTVTHRQPPYFFPTIVQRDEGMIFLYPGDSGYESADPEAQGVMHRSISTQGTFRYIRQVDWQALI